MKYLSNLLEKIKNFLNPSGVLERLVITEAKLLRENATKDELNKLNFIRLDPESKTQCIYGQMTGLCHSVRANELIYKCAKRVYNINRDNGWDLIQGAKLNGSPKKIEGYVNRIKLYFSPIEKFIAQKKNNQGVNNKILVDFLKGERETLNFK